MTAPVLVDTYGNDLRQSVDMATPPAVLAPAQKNAVAQLFDDARARQIITPLLPKGVTYDEVYAETAHVIAANPELLECTTMSLIYAIGRAVQTGLEIGRTVFLVPFSTNVAKRGEPARYVKRAQRIIGYQGEIELVLRAGGARAIYANAVFEHEDYKVEQGTEPRILHRPIADPDARGKIVGAYAVAKINAYDLRIEAMHIKEIDRIRADCSKVCKPEKVPVCPPWYARKTAIHKLVTQLPMNPRMRIVANWLANEEQDELDEVAAA